MKNVLSPNSENSISRNPEISPSRNASLPNEPAAGTCYGEACRASSEVVGCHIYHYPTYCTITTGKLFCNLLNTLCSCVRKSRQG